MNIKGWIATKTNFGLDIQLYSQAYKIRYDVFIEDYTQEFKIAYTSESLLTLNNNYRIVYQSTVDNDVMNFKIRYTTFEELNDESLNFRIVYQSEVMASLSSVYKVKYESEGVESFENRKIFRIYYESDSVSTIDIDRTIKFESESSESYDLNFKVKYTSEKPKDIVISSTLLKDIENRSYLLVGVYSKTTDTPYNYLVVNNLPSILCYDFETSKLPEKVLSFDDNTFNNVDTHIRSEYNSYIFRKYYLIKDVTDFNASSVDIYTTKDNPVLQNEAKSYLFNIQTGYEPLDLEVEGINFKEKNSTEVKDYKSLNFTNKEISIELLQSSETCCFGASINNKGNNNCTP